MENFLHYEQQPSLYFSLSLPFQINEHCPVPEIARINQYASDGRGRGVGGNGRCAKIGSGRMEIANAKLDHGTFKLGLRSGLVPVCPPGPLGRFAAPSPATATAGYLLIKLLPYDRRPVGSLDQVLQVQMFAGYGEPGLRSLLDYIHTSYRGRALCFFLSFPKVKAESPRNSSSAQQQLLRTSRLSRSSKATVVMDDTMVPLLGTPRLGMDTRRTGGLQSISIWCGPSTKIAWTRDAPRELLLLLRAAGE